MKKDPFPLPNKAIRICWNEAGSSQAKREKFVGGIRIVVPPLSIESLATTRLASLFYLSHSCHLKSFLL